MNRIQRLISDSCLDGVEYYPIRYARYLRREMGIHNQS